MKNGRFILPFFYVFCVLVSAMSRRLNMYCNPFRFSKRSSCSSSEGVIVCRTLMIWRIVGDRFPYEAGGSASERPPVGGRNLGSFMIKARTFLSMRICLPLPPFTPGIFSVCQLCLRIQRFTVCFVIPTNSASSSVVNFSGILVMLILVAKIESL